MKIQKKNNMKQHIAADEAMAQLGLGQNAEGAIPIGTKIYKTNTEDGDGNPDGTEGIVVGSLKIPDDVSLHPNGKKIIHIYFVDYPNTITAGFPVAVMDYKIKI